MPELDRADEGWRRAFTARLTAAYTLLEKATANLTLAQVNHRERPGVLSIAFSLAHVVGGQDRNVAKYLDKAPMLWDSWAAKVGYTGEMPQRGTPMSVAEAIQFKDVDAWRAYQAAVFARAGSALANTPLARFNEIAVAERPAEHGNAFAFLFVPSGPIAVWQACEAYLFQHTIRHVGEIEHARALVGLGGVA